MFITVLGCGTSSGVPTLTCECETCTSDNPKNNRTRCSIIIQTDKQNIIVDISPDFRQQMLTNKIKKIDAIIFTHAHFDHIGGFDDIRAYNYRSGAIPIYLNERTYQSLKKTFYYAFEKIEQTGGGVPESIVKIIDVDKFQINNLEIEPIELIHGNLPVLGYRIGNFAYITDLNYISEESLDKLYNLEVLIISALRFEKHPTHFNVEEALEVINKLEPKKAYLTHLAHQINYDKLESELPPNVHLAYDGLNFEVN